VKKRGSLDEREGTLHLAEEDVRGAVKGRESGEKKGQLSA